MRRAPVFAERSKVNVHATPKGGYSVRRASGVTARERAALNVHGAPEFRNTAAVRRGAVNFRARARPARSSPEQSARRLLDSTGELCTTTTNGRRDKSTVFDGTPSPGFGWGAAASRQLFATLSPGQREGDSSKLIVLARSWSRLPIFAPVPIWGRHGLGRRPA
jgi:hypothetical protein